MLCTMYIYIYKCDALYIAQNEIISYSNQCIGYLIHLHKNVKFEIRFRYLMC